MSTHCCDHVAPKLDAIVNLVRYRKILWIALVVNAAMFLVEIVAGVQSGSLSLLADAVDFAGDAMNYAVSLAVLASALAWRARAAMLKALSMMGFGLYVLGAALWSVWNGGVPQATTMGSIALVALVANVAVANRDAAVVLAASPVVLAPSLDQAPHHEVLVNLGAPVPSGFERFARLIEVVAQDDDDRQRARHRWKHYADRGYALTKVDQKDVMA